ncbi:Glutathione S-transferase, C-terminal-like domain and Thioredoxin-like fold domain-containing protein [Strongyloides ratti]|uniref:Glutathione S-transferase, C-terminal-like domain and Thioredoxin-like fold domain-containing protein n=1 Tax=Strongyloides ratti TaxID=34506 RepID=A0A090KU64_STRRB|nr:Glutathione S-transferase, C-terminal-like domain and Thioredoxin-like fold domain-containing protein [Strongyloides ratti]CEF59405.1 Glutathione S-transferase, C-terminal-like domain and Thioredoxin-like fold domain-containing protein [Strongyloides ratti]
MSRYTLWIYSGTHGNLVNGDPFTQELFMVLKLLNKEGLLDFDVRTLIPGKNNDILKNEGLLTLPGITSYDGSIAISQSDEVIYYLQNKYINSVILKDDEESKNVTADFFRHFCHYLKNATKESKNLTYELRRLNNFLKKREYIFLIANYPTYLDCLVLAKLHTLRIAGKFLKDYKIPKYLERLWEYLYNGYKLDAFKKSCPSDQNIILFWSEKEGVPKLTDAYKVKLCNMIPIYSLTEDEFDFGIKNPFKNI